MKDILAKYLRKKKLKFTEQRSFLLGLFAAERGHVSAEELYACAKRKDPSIGQATVFRFMKLLVEAGLAQAAGLGGKMTRYEPKRRHHDHLVCLDCGAVVEFKSNMLEKEQDRIASLYGFILKEHRLEMFGLCRDCRSQKEAKT